MGHPQNGLYSMVLSLCGVGSPVVLLKNTVVYTLKYYGKQWVSPITPPIWPPNICVFKVIQNQVKLAGR